MLQQTQVSTVIPYYLRFMERFPQIDVLAAAPLDDVLSHWSGLGYYARARNLHRAAQEVVEQFDGQLPATAELLTNLPGIGPSTAAAIVALTWNRRATILDGNVKRVLSRYHRVAGWSGESKVQQQLWRLADRQTPATNCRSYTQAIMDLGATVCRRRNPDCHNCPLSADCGAWQHNEVALYPASRPRKERPHKSWRMLLISDPAGALLLRQRPPSGIWGGLWSPPEIEVAQTDIGSWSADQLGFTATPITELEPVEHKFTHFDLTLIPVVCQARQGVTGSIMDRPGQLWYNHATHQIGLPTAVSRVITRYSEYLSGVTGP